MISYPNLHNETFTIGVTAPSSGVPEELHPLLHQVEEKMKQDGKDLIFGETSWQQQKVRAASGSKRAEEFNRMIRREDVHLIIPPWGGELFIETLEHLEFNNVPAKWVLGYSDTSLLLLALTVNTGIATAHGTNLVDLRGETSDATTAKWLDVLSTDVGESVTQYSSTYYQKEWDFENPTPHIFNLTEPTEWKTVSGESETVEGRLLGGCLDVVRHLIGTPFDQVKKFQQQVINVEPIVWFFESCELSPTDLRRTLVQMRLAGWFDHTSGILFGRSASHKDTGGYNAEEVYQELADELGVPVVYDIDCGHLPPQITFVNGAYGEIQVKNGKGKVVQTFKS